MELLAILEQAEDNKKFIDDPACADSIYMCLDFYKKAGYDAPWICYYAAIDGILVGSAAFKGKPVEGKVEIAYGAFPQHRQKGVGSMICKALVDLAEKTDETITITARTLPEENYSTRILRKNGFKLQGTVSDPDDGEVWEWQYMP